MVSASIVCLMSSLQMDMVIMMMMMMIIMIMIIIKDAMSVSLDSNIDSGLSKLKLWNS